jgi:hypothetical protein
MCTEPCVQYHLCVQHTMLSTGVQCSWTVDRGILDSRDSRLLVVAPVWARSEQLYMCSAGQGKSLTLYACVLFDLDELSTISCSVCRQGLPLCHSGS